MYFMEVTAVGYPPSPPVVDEAFLLFHRDIASNRQVRTYSPEKSPANTGDEHSKKLNEDAARLRNYHAMEVGNIPHDLGGRLIYEHAWRSLVDECVIGPEAPSCRFRQVDYGD
jgi:hypothetical protein